MIDQTRRNLARKTIRGRNPKPRGTLKPFWSTIPYGPIVDCTPHTIIIDTHSCKDTLKRNNDITIPTETQPERPEPKFRWINFVACKTVGEYSKNKRKMEIFCLTEKVTRSENAQDPDAPVLRQLLLFPLICNNYRPLLTQLTIPDRLRSLRSPRLSVYPLLTVYHAHNPQKGPQRRSPRGQPKMENGKISGKKPPSQQHAIPQTQS